MLTRYHKQFLILFVSLVILLAQFAVVVHASEHPFHQEDTLCLSFQTAGLDKHFINHAPCAVFNDIPPSEVAELFLESSSFSVFSNYSSRAPPVTVI